MWRKLFHRLPFRTWWLPKSGTTTSGSGTIAPHELSNRLRAAQEHLDPLRLGAAHPQRADATMTAETQACSLINDMRYPQ